MKWCKTIPDAMQFLQEQIDELNTKASLVAPPKTMPVEQISYNPPMVVYQYKEYKLKQLQYGRYTTDT